MLLFLLACAPELVVVSPTHGSTITAPWIPLFVDIGEDRVGEQPKVRLDGRVVDQPFGARHARYERLGEGSEWIGMLDLTQVDRGHHTVRVRFEDGLAESEFTFDPPEHRVEVLVERPDGSPLWAKVLVFDDQGDPVLLTAPNMEEIDPRARDHSLHTVLVREGSGVFWLDDGDYTLFVTRGIRDGIERLDVSIDQDTTLTSTLALEVPTPGWSTSELHLHTAWSPDSFAPGEPRFDSLLCSDVQAAAITDHDLVAPVPTEGLTERYGDQLTIFAGMESSHSLYDDEEEDWDTIGHFNLIPWEAQRLTKHLDSADLLVELHAPARIRQLNHPRGIEFNVEKGPEGVHAFLTAMGLPLGSPLVETERSAPLLKTTFWQDLDAMEVVNRFSWELYRKVREDWFALWSKGYAVTGTGNADTHALEQELIGFPVNFTPCPPEGGVDPECVQDAVVRGAVRVSSGPIVSLSLDQGAAPVGEGELMRLQSGQPLYANLTVQAASWVPVGEVRLIVDGAVVQRWEPDLGRDGVLLWEKTLELTLSEGDHFVLLEAGHPIYEEMPTDFREALGAYGWIAPSYVPIGWSNPIRVDGDGDGDWGPSD